ncbi:MAG: tetratricopeptide repeat protein [Brasilonema sp.]
MNAIFWAIKKSQTSNCIIITCRYDFNFEYDSDDLGKWEDDIHKQPLDAMRGVDLQKKWDRLTASNKKSQEDENWQLQMKKRADGNPRLLELFNEKLQQPNIDEANLVELQKQVLTEKQKEELKKQIDPPMREMLQRGLVFELPVPRKALADICQTIPNFDLEQHIEKAIALGLLEVSYDKKLLRVPRILLLVKLIEKLDETSSDLYRQATNVLYDHWFKSEEEKTERLLEIHRLAKLGNVIEIEVEMTEILARRWLKQSRLREVVKLCTETLKDLKDHNDLKNCPMVISIHALLADSCVLQRCYEDAKLQYDKAKKAISASSRGADQLTKDELLNMAKIYDGLGYLYCLINQFNYRDQAKKHLIDALNIRNEILGVHRDTVQSLGNVAYWYREKKQWEEANYYYEKALNMSLKLSEQGDIVVVDCYNNLGALFYEKECYDEAEEWLCKALTLSKELLERHHVTIAIISRSLAKTYLERKNYQMTQILFHKVLEIRERLLGKSLDTAEDFHIAEDMWNLGRAYNGLKNYKQAECYLLQALGTLKRLKVKVTEKEKSFIDHYHKIINGYTREILYELKIVYNELKDFDKVKTICCHEEKIKKVFCCHKQETDNDHNCSILVSSIDEIIDSVLSEFV